MCVPGIRHLAQDGLQDIQPLQGCGPEALTDRSRRPVRYANQLPAQIERMIVGQTGEAALGARKIRELLVRKLAGEVRIPAKSTVHAVLDRLGLVSQTRKRNRANKDLGTHLCQATRPNDLCRLQRRVQARQRPLLLPADSHRPGLALPVGLRSA